MNHQAINLLKSKKHTLRTASVDSNSEESKIGGSLERKYSSFSSLSSSVEFDFLHLILHLALKLSSKNQQTTKKLIELVRKLTLGRRFYKCHIEFLYQYLKVKGASNCVKGRFKPALEKLETALKMLYAMFE